MLELNNYYIQELENLTDLFTSIFVIIDDIYNEIIPMIIRIDAILRTANFQIVR